jgi:hypothetical protein
MTVSTSPRTADHGQSAVIVRPDVALLIVNISEHAANVSLYGTLRSRPVSRSFIMAVAKISIGPATSSDCAVGVASKTMCLDYAFSPDSPISSHLGVAFERFGLLFATVAAHLEFVTRRVPIVLMPRIEPHGTGLLFGRAYVGIQPSDRHRARRREDTLTVVSIHGATESPQRQGRRRNGQSVDRGH